jgi:broad specificity phosphatase PhoE
MERRRILLIRHGQTQWNVEGRWQGTLATSLNTNGFAQARALARALRSRPITAIYTSDLQRAVQTATVLGSVFNLTPVEDPRWRELNLGIFQGLTFPEIVKRHPQELGAMEANYLDYEIPDGESRRMLQARAHAALQSIIEREHEGEVAVVTHGGTIRALLLRLFGDNSKVKGLRIPNTSVTTIEVNSGSWHLIEAASTAHLVR